MRDSPKPRSIVAFDRFFWAGMLLSVLEILLGWNELTARDPGEPQMRATISILIIMFFVAAMLLVMVFLRYGIVQRQWRWAKWTYCLLMLVSVSLYLGVDLASEMDAALLASICGTMLLLAAACFLFRRDAVAWLAGKAWIDPSTFA